MQVRSPSANYAAINGFPFDQIVSVDVYIFFGVVAPSFEDTWRGVVGFFPFCKGCLFGLVVDDPVLVLSLVMKPHTLLML